MGSETITYKDLQIQPLMSKPEKVYKQYQLEAFKQIRGGIKAVNNTFQMGIVDTRSLFNDGFLKALGYNPSEKIKYTVLDPALVLSWLRTNISPNVENNVSAQWRAPTLEEIAIEYLQNTYSGMILAERSFLIDGIRWYISGVTSTSPTTTDATCYKDKLATAIETIPEADIASIDDDMVTISGVNYWRVLKKDVVIPESIDVNGVVIPEQIIPGEVIDVRVQYTTIQCPSITDDAIKASVAKYNNSVQTSIFESEPDPESGSTSGWNATVRMSVYIDDSGDIVVTGSIVTFSSQGYFSTWQSNDTKKAAVAGAVNKVKILIDEEIKENIERLVAYYVLDGELKIIIEEMDKTVVTNTANAKAYPIIPLRQNYSFVNESRGLKVVLNKIGMTREDFKNSLADTHIKEAALMFILNIRDSNPAVVKAVFETVVTMVETSTSGAPKGAGRMPYTLDLSYKQVNMKTGFSFTLETISGSIGPVGTYKKYPNGIRKQISEEYYKELVFRGSQTDWYVGGYELKKKRSRRDNAISFGSIMDNTHDDSIAVNRVYIPVTDLGLKALNYRELHYVIARSMNMMVLSITEVKSKWYQSGFFQFVMIVVIAVVTYFTGGAAGAAYGALAAGVVYAAGAVAILGLMGVDTGVIGQIIQVAAAIYTFGASLSSTALDIVLASASTLTKFAVIASDINMHGAMTALQDKAKATQAELEESEKLVEEISENTQKGLWVGIEDRLPDTLYALSSTDLMCGYDILYDYDSVMGDMVKSVGV